MPPGRLPREVFQARPTGGRPRGVSAESAAPMTQARLKRKTASTSTSTSMSTSMSTVSLAVPERRAAVDHGDGFGHVSVIIVSKHAALHPFMEHLHFTLEAEREQSDISDEH
ncbi:hypothetical protein ILYODFUR_038497 [Ilyodon furcidens]|uniref:Uncharacterized protein n=1 Tax=Ilyodon furcidens TaxID=33524 RepID=A0ABV0U2H8_9TELE